MSKLDRNIESACTMLQEKHDAQFAEVYGEPGYTDTPRGIILCNWNNVPKGMGDWLESIGYSLEWSDEWISEHINGKSRAYRTQPDSYSWRPSYIWLASGDGIMTADDDAAEVIDECACNYSNDEPRSVPHWITAADLTQAGYILFEGDKETGWHPGQNDKTQDVFKRAWVHATRVVGRITGQGQFDIAWEVWTMPEDDDAAQ